jgi:hypothetical protein
MIDTPKISNSFVALTGGGGGGGGGGGEAAMLERNGSRLSTSRSQSSRGF